MSIFGDIEPEDSWDATDPVPVQLLNLFRRAELVDGITSVSVRDQLDVLQQRMQKRLEDRIDTPTRNRANMILADIEFVRTRLG